MGNFVMIKVVNCKSPHCETKLTKGYGYAMDYICSLSGKCIAGYCEWTEDEPQDGKIPDFCPLLPSDEKSYIGEGI
jgi:hypothetical protein